jgi:SAM-dependent methyltransferase
MQLALYEDCSRSKALPMQFLSSSLMPLIRRAREDGLQSTVMLIGKNLPRPFRGWLIRRRIRQHCRFDARYGVDTQAPVRILDLEAANPAAAFANRYEGTPIAAIHKVIRRLKVDRPQFTFIDLGSGKGRVLLIAAQYPFKSVIGIEFSETLHSIALSNIESFCGSGHAKTKPISVNCDAAAFDFSGLKNKIVFCYNPFGAEVMTRVMSNLQHSGPSSNKTLLVYLGPMASVVAERLCRFPVLRKGEFLSEFGFFERYSIFRLH